MKRRAPAIDPSTDIGMPAELLLDPWDQHWISKVPRHHKGMAPHYARRLWREACEAWAVGRGLTNDRGGLDWHRLGLVLEAARSRVAR